MNLSIIKWTFIERNVFRITVVIGIKLQVKKAVQNIRESWDAELSCKGCYILCAFVLYVLKLHMHPA